MLWREAWSTARRDPSPALCAAAFAFDGLIAGLFAFLGWRAGNLRAWAFVVGLLLYALDGLIFVVIQDWMSGAFHAWALFAVWRGYSNLRQIRALETQSGL
jgi:hypothetical protein